MREFTRVVAMVGVLLLGAACSKPGENGLRDSFSQQLAANKFVKDFQKSGDDFRFTGPGADGTIVKWRVHIDSAAITETDDAEKPYKGRVLSSWYPGDGNRKVEPDRLESNLPLELISTGLAQDCWALWNKSAKKWEWE
jgi:hypothetical protein